MIELVHSVSVPAFLKRQTNQLLRDEDGWEEYIFEMLKTHQPDQDVIDIVRHYKSWLRIEAYREVQKMLIDNNDGRHARQKLEFMIRRECR